MKMRRTIASRFRNHVCSNRTREWVRIFRASNSQVSKHLFRLSLLGACLWTGSYFDSIYAFASPVSVNNASSDVAEASDTETKQVGKRSPQEAEDNRPVTKGEQVQWLDEVSVDSLVASQLFELEPAKRKKLAELPIFETQADLKKYAEKTIQRWSEFLGAFSVDGSRTPPSVEILETEVLSEGLLQKLVRYETEPGQFVEAFVLSKAELPSSSPAVVVFHSTFKNSIHQCVGGDDPKSGSPPNEHEMRKAYALHLAKRGFITLSPRNYLWRDNVTMDLQGQTLAFLNRNPGRKGMSRMLLDVILAVDVIESLPGVDGNRIGVIGHSLGAKEVLYSMAFDSRVKVGVSSEGGIGIEQSNWDADWYLSKACQDPTFDLNHHELVACIAPRPLLVIGGDASDGLSTIPYLRPAVPAYRLFNSPVRLALYNHGQGHVVTEESLVRSLEWLETYLK